jgi:hypothetical protein
MTKKLIVPLASALAALAVNAVQSTESAAATNDQRDVTKANDAQDASMSKSNTIVSNGESLLGFVVSEQPDGTIVAQHVSHASHASHVSHYSSR